MNIVRIPMPNIEKIDGWPSESANKKMIDVIRKNKPDSTDVISIIKYQKFIDKEVDIYGASEELISIYINPWVGSFQSELIGLPDYYYITRTYINSQFINGDRKVVFLPYYKGYDKTNQVAHKIYEEVYNEAYGQVDIVPIYSDLIIPYQGAIHCITNLIPSVNQ